MLCCVMLQTGISYRIIKGPTKHKVLEPYVFERIFRLTNFTRINWQQDILRLAPSLKKIHQQGELQLKNTNSYTIVWSSMKLVYILLIFISSFL